MMTVQYFMRLLQKLLYPARAPHLRLCAFSLLVLWVAAACAEVPPTVIVPTLAVLPTADTAATAQAAVPTVTPEPTVTPVPTATLTLTATPEPTATVTLTATPEPTATATVPPTRTLTPSMTLTATVTHTLTPSQTITDTITPTLTPTLTPSPDVGVFSGLAGLLANATVAPLETRYPAPTLTALAAAGQTLAATRRAGGASVTAVAGVFINGVFVPAPTAVVAGPPVLGVSPTPVVGVPGVPTALCGLPPPPVLAAALASDPAFGTALGCTIAPPGAVTVGTQVFERGLMVYVGGAPGLANAIYVLTRDGRFRRFEDTWVSGVDPEQSGEAAPPGLLVPIRGFLKVWSSNPDVRAALGYATEGERGENASQVLFNHGRGISVPTRSSSLVLLDAAPVGGVPNTGTWRVYTGAF
jgi:hypothetical protein